MSSFVLVKSTSTGPGELLHNISIWLIYAHGKIFSSSNSNNSFDKCSQISLSSTTGHCVGPEDEREPALIISISAKSIVENVSGVEEGKQRHSQRV